jgi:hypothetical protein
VLCDPASLNEDLARASTAALEKASRVHDAWYGLSVACSLGCLAGTIASAITLFHKSGHAESKLDAGDEVKDFIAAPGASRRCPVGNAIGSSASRRR